MRSIYQIWMNTPSAPLYQGMLMYWHGQGWRTGETLLKIWFPE